MPVHFDSRKKRWRFTFNRIVAHQRHRSSRLLPKDWNRAQAEAYARKEEGRLYAVASGVVTEDRLIDDAVALYIKHKIPTQKAGHKAGLHLGALIDYYEGKRLSELPDVARKYAEEMAKINPKTGKPFLTPGTVRNRLAYLKSACRYGWRRHKLCEHDPTARMELPAANNERHVYLRVDELNRLLKAFDDKEAAALTKMAFYTGLRWIEELLPLTQESIRKNGKETWLYVGDTKNGSPRMVPVHSAIKGCLRHLPFGKHWRTYYASFERAREAAGMQCIRMHDLRHSLASEIISSGGTLSDVQGALHHRSVVSSKRYAHLYPERVRKVMMGVGKRG